MAIGASLVALMTVAAPAQAQDARDAQQASGTPSSAADDQGAGDIVVTARYSGYAKAIADTALKVPIPLKELPQSASIITSAFIRDIDAHDLNDVVPYIAGASRALSSFLGAGGIIIRGQSLDSNNGYKLDGGQFSDFGSIDDAIVDSIEILKGPVASLYGRGPGVGVVNYLTKRPTDRFAVNTELEAGSYDHFRGVLDVNQPVSSAIRARVIGYASNDDNHVNSGNARTLGLYGTIEADLTGTTRIRITDSFKHFRNARGTYRFATANDDGDLVPPFFVKRSALDGASNDLYRYSDNLVSGRIDQQLGENTSFLLRSSYDRFDRQAMFSTVFTLDPLVEGEPYTIGDLSSGNAQKRRIESTNVEANLVRHVSEGGFAGSSLLLGASYDRTTANAFFGPVAFQNDDQTIVLGRDGIDFGPAVRTGPYRLNTDTRTIGKGTFGQIVVRYAGLTLLGSGRYDWYIADDKLGDARDRQEKLSYRLGASYALTGQLNAYVGYGTGFNPIGSIGTDGFLPPETDKNIEAGLKFSSANGRSNFSVAAFRTRKTHVAIALPPPNDSFSIDLGTQTFKGIEADAQLSPIKGLDLIGALTLLDSKLEDGSRPGAVPKVSASGFARFTLDSVGLTGFNVSGGASYVGRAALNTPSGDFAGLGRVGHAPGYVLLRAGAGYTGFKFGEIAITANNLLNKRYFIGDGFATFLIQEGDPRSVTISLRSSF